eukprot:1298410-Pleurochrysis_carterae.AAC.2
MEKKKVAAPKVASPPLTLHRIRWAMRSALCSNPRTRSASVRPALLRSAEDGKCAKLGSDLERLRTDAMLIIACLRWPKMEA